MQGLNHVHSAKSRRFSRWQLVAASDSLAHVIEVSLFVFLCGFYVVFLSFFFLTCVLPCFAGKAGSVWDDLSLIWSFRLIKEVHLRVILPSCRGGFCSTCLKNTCDLVSSCRSRWHETPPQTLPSPPWWRTGELVLFAPLLHPSQKSVFSFQPQHLVFCCCCLFVLAEVGSLSKHR